MVKGISETIKNKAKEQKGGFLSMLLGILVVSSGQEKLGTCLCRVPKIFRSSYLSSLKIWIFNSNRYTIKCQLERNVCASLCPCRFRK